MGLVFIKEGRTVLMQDHGFQAKGMERAYKFIRMRVNTQEALKTMKNMELVL